MAMRSLSAMHIKLERSEAEFSEQRTVALPGLESIPSRVGYPAKEFGRSRLIRRIKTFSSLVLILQVCMSSLEHPRTFRQASNQLHQIEKENAGESARGVFFFEDK